MSYSKLVGVEEWMFEDLSCEIMWRESKCPTFLIDRHQRRIQELSKGGRERKNWNLEAMEPTRTCESGKFQALKARSHSRLGSLGNVESCPAGPGSEHRNRRDFEHFMPNGIHFGILLIGLNRVPNFAVYRVSSIWGRLPSTDIEYLTKCKYFNYINFMNN